MSDWFSIARIIVGVAIMGLASLSDLKTRTVDNKYWIIMGTIGLILLAFEILFYANIGSSDFPGYNMGHLLALIPATIMFYDVFWDREPLVGDEGVNFTALFAFIIGGLSALYVIYDNGLNIETIQLLSIPVMIIIGYIFFYTGLLHGGADAKAFMAIAVLVPFLPVIGDVLPAIQYPDHMTEAMSVMFPFAFLVLMNAALITAFVLPLFMFLRNIMRKDYGFPEMLLGYTMDIDDISKNFVWPMEFVKDGELVMVLFPKRNVNIKQELEKLKERGLEKVWVTPKLPFIVPMLLGFIFSFVIGNVMTLIFNGL